MKLSKITLICFTLGALLLSGSRIAQAVFSDVGTGHTNFEAINYVKDEGIVSGYADGTFRPDNTINRAEFTKIIIGALFSETLINNCISENIEPTDETAFFPDVPKNIWFAKYICVAKINQVINGYPDGTFLPGNSINFSEAAKIISTAFGFTLMLSDDVWYKPFVQALAARKAIPVSIAGFSQNITRGEMSEIIYRLMANVTDKTSLSYESMAGLPEIIPEPVPAPTIQVKSFTISAHQFSFTPNSIRVNEGDTVKLKLISEDVTHGFSLPEFNINETISAGETVDIEFIADKKGQFDFRCSFFCGSGHAGMSGVLIVE